MNRINESNPKRIQNNPQNDPKTTTKGALGPSWDGLGEVLGRPWGLLGSLGMVLAAIFGPTDHKIEHKVAPGQWLAESWVDFGGRNASPKRFQNDPKTSQQSRRKMHHYFIPLGAVLERSWVDLGPLLEVKINVFQLVLQRFREHRLFREK